LSLIRSGQLEHRGCVNQSDRRETHYSARPHLRKSYLAWGSPLIGCLNLSICSYGQCSYSDQTPGRWKRCSCPYFNMKCSTGTPWRLPLVTRSYRPQVDFCSGWRGCPTRGEGGLPTCFRVGETPSWSSTPRWSHVGCLKYWFKAATVGLTHLFDPRCDVIALTCNT